MKRLILAPGLFRVVLAYLVVIDHSTGLAVGSTAVYLFFVLSGYWVHKMWFKEYAPLESPYLAFMVSRFWRLLPVFYTCLAIFVAVNALLHYPNTIDGGTGWHLAHFIVAQATLLGYSQLMPDQFIIYPAWSLDIELQFYIVAPFLIWILAKYRAFSLPRLALVLFTVVCFALFITIFKTHAQTAYLPMYLIFFLIGMFGSHYDYKPRPALAVASLGSALLAIFFIVILIRAGHSVFPTAITAWLELYNPIAVVFPALLASPYALATVNEIVVRNPKMPVSDRDLSSLSYEIYLLHTTLILVLERFNVHAHGRIFGTAIMWVVLLPASYAVYRIVDRPIDGMRTAWVKSRKKKLTALPS